MGKWNRLIYYLLINVLVSACTTLVVLAIWDRTQAPAAPEVDLLATPVALESPQANSTQYAQTTSQSIDLTPTSLPVDVALENVIEYQVEFGDTLGIIADKFDITIEDLMRVNQLSDPNSLSVGLLLYIPTTPEAVPTKSSTPTVASLAGTAAVTSGTPQELRVVITGVIGAGDLNAEHVFITRTGDGELNLAGWQLRDEDGNEYVFPQLQLYRSGGINVWTTSGTSTVIDLYWGMQSPVWKSGEEVTLLDASGKERATYLVP